MQGFAPADEALVFRQKCPEPFPPVRGPPGSSASAPYKMVRELAALKQPSPKRSIRGCGSAAPKGGEKLKNTTLIQTADEEGFPIQHSILILCVILVFPLHLRCARRSRSPESTSRRRLFESFDMAQDRLREFLSHRIRGGSRGILESLLLSRLGGTAHRQKWFWFLLPKQKGLVVRGRHPERYTNNSRLRWIA
jgi:hypothetical protein